MEEEYDAHVHAVKLLSKAEEMFREGDYSGCRDVLNDSAALDQSLGRTWEMMGVLDIAEGEFQAASYNFETAINCDGYQQIAEMARDVMESGSWPQGEEEEVKVNRMTVMGEMFLKARMWDAAAACFTPLLDKVELDWRLLSILGLVNREMDNLERSVEYYRKAADMPDAPPEVFSDLSIALIKSGELDEAEDMLRMVLENIDTVPQVWNNLGTVLEAKGDLDDALDAYYSAVEVNERYYPSLYSIGRILQKKGQMEEAKEYMEKALDIEGRVYNLEDVSNREERESDDEVHAKEIMTPMEETIDHPEQ